MLELGAWLDASHTPSKCCETILLKQSKIGTSRDGLTMDPVDLEVRIRWRTLCASGKPIYPDRPVFILNVPPPIS